jgi:alpha/beta hydrolase fold
VAGVTSTDSTYLVRGPDPASGTLLLRDRTGTITGRLTWPAIATSESVGPSGGPGRPELPAVLLLGPDVPARVDRAACATRLSCRAGALVLDLPWNRSAGLAKAEYALGWLADHASEVGADPQRLVVIGLTEATNAAAALACRARDEGWPPLAQHILALPGPPTPRSRRGPAHFDPTGSRPVDGVCGCTLILDPASRSHPYAAQLRAAGVAVRQHRLPVVTPAAAWTDALVPALVAALAATWAARRRTSRNARTGTTALDGRSRRPRPTSNRRKDPRPC